MFHHEDYTHELEQEGRVETALIGLRYTGPKSSVPPRQPRQQGGWPGNQTFQGGAPKERDAETGKVREREPGPVQIGINPDWTDDSVEGGTLTGLEALPDFEVIYDQETLAEVMLEANYLPPVVFGTPPEITGDNRTTPNYDIRQAVFEYFDLDDIGSGPGSHDEYREQLAEIAGIDLTGADESPVDGNRAQQYVDDYSRAELKDAADELREGPDDIALNSGKSDFAEFLAKQDPAEVRAILEGEDEDDEADEDSEE